MKPEPPLTSGGLFEPLRVRLAPILGSHVVRSIGVLVGGTASAQAITALVMPVTTRLYSPQDFSAAAVFAGLIGILSVAACFRFDVALALPEHDEEAANLLVLAVAVALVFGAICAIALALMPVSWLSLLGEPAVLPWLWLLPLGVAGGGTYLALQMWFVRRRVFRAVAFSRVFQSGSAAAAQIGFGLARSGPVGLIVGQLLNYGAGSLWLGTATVTRDWRILRQVTLRTMMRAFSTHRRFPLISTWEAIANAASIQAPILLIAALATGPEAGYLTLGIFLLQIPMALLGNSIGQVYLAGAPSAFTAGRLDRYTATALKALIRLASAPMGFLAVVSPFAFGFVFGEPWIRSGILVSWMTPWFFMQFIVSPISTSLHVTGRQGAAMVLQLGGLLLRLGGVAMAATMLPTRISEVFAVTGFLFYTAYLITIARTLRLTLLDIVRPLRDALPLATLGAGAGLMVMLGLRLVGNF